MLFVQSNYIKELTTMTISRKKTASVLALSALAVTTTLALPATVSAGSGYEPTHLITMEQFSDNSTRAYGLALEKPILSSTAYNVAAKYTWFASNGANALAMYTSYHPDLAPEIFETTTFTEVSFPATGTKDCRAHYILGASYNTNTGDMSNKYDLSWAEATGSGTTKIRYGIDAKYNIKYQINHAQAPAKFPTSYDQSYFEWKHSAKNYSTLKGTISYHGYVSDIEVVVPWIGTKESSVTLDGVRFSFETGPWWGTIKANKSVNTSEVGFGFAVA